MAGYVIVDTDILIDAGRGVQQAIECLKQIETQSALSISVISQMELIVGCRNKEELRALEEFLARFYRISLNEVIALQAVALLEQYRLSHG